jgi:hypothetical protein
MDSLFSDLIRRKEPQGINRQEIILLVSSSTISLVIEFRLLTLRPAFSMRFTFFKLNVNLSNVSLKVKLSKLHGKCGPRKRNIEKQMIDWSPVKH